MMSTVMLVTSNGQSDGEQVLILQIVGPHQETSVLTQLGDVPDGPQTQGAAGLHLPALQPQLPSLQCMF